MGWMSDHFEMCVDMDMATFDPNNLIAGASRRLANNVCPGLLGIGADWEPKGLLAESFHADGRYVEVTLRPDVELHNGTALDAALVLKNFQRILDPASGCYQRDDFTVVEKVEVVGLRRVLFKLREPRSSFPSLLANHVGITDVDAHDETPLPVGAGIFRCTEWVPGKYMKLESAAQALHKGLRAIKWKIEPNPTQRTTGLLDGVHDGVWMPDANLLAELRAHGSEVHITPSEAPTHLTFNFGRSPWNVLEVRQAIAAAIDRKALVSAVLGGRAVASWTSYPAGSRWHASIPEPKYDPEYGRWLLRNAGYPEIVDMLPVDSDFGVRMGTVIADQLRHVGIRLKVERHESPQWWPGHYLSGDWGIILQTWTPMPDPDQLIARRYHSRGILNSGQFRSESVDRALEQGRRGVDHVLRRDCYENAQQILFDEVASVYLFHADMVTASRGDWSGLKPTVLSELDLTELHPVGRSS